MWISCLGRLCNAESQHSVLHDLGQHCMSGTDKQHLLEQVILHSMFWCAQHKDLLPSSLSSFLHHYRDMACSKLMPSMKFSS